MLDFRFRAPLWLWKSDASWHFVTVPEEPSSTIKSLAPEAKRGFGSVRVKVKIGETVWKTSVFPDKSSGCYLLPIKKTVRTAEALTVGDEAEITLELML